MWNFKNYKNRVALLDDNGKRLTYDELEKECNKISYFVNERCLVFCLCKNNIGSLIGYLSFIQNKIVPVLLNSNIDNSLLESLMQIYRPSYIWMPIELTAKYNNLDIVYENEGYILLNTRYEKKYDLNENLCLLLTTSGSTGSPKLVRQSYNNVLTNAQQIIEYLNIDSSERPITTLPMNYTYGLSIINSHILSGATILLTDESIMSKKFWSFFKQEGATSFGGVPYTYEILDKLRFFNMDLDSLRYMTQAGGKLSPKLHKKLAQFAQEKNKKFIVMYGQCEATARMGYLPYDKSLEKYGSMGISIPGGRFSLIDINKNVINEADVVGELVYEGENVTMGYATCGEDLIKGDERNGRLETGDMAKRDADGYYYIVGRKKRFLKIYGNRVNLDEIDRMIKSEFNFIDCASSGIDDHMYIFITDEDLKKRVKQFICEKTKLNQAAFTIIVVDDIPKNDAGKIMYKDLEKYFKQ